MTWADIEEKRLSVDIMMRRTIVLVQRNRLIEEYLRQNQHTQNAFLIIDLDN